MKKTTKEKMRDLIPYFSTVLGVVSIVLLWNLIGAIFLSISVTGIVLWLFQVFFTGAAIYLGMYSAVYKASHWFLTGFFDFSTEKYTA